jgi:hypothetical protein
VATAPCDAFKLGDTVYARARAVRATSSARRTMDEP